MRKLMVAAMMLAAVSMSVNAAKKDKKAAEEPVLGIKSGVITMANNMGSFGGGAGGFGGGAGMGMGGFGGGAGMGMGGGQGMGQRPQGQGGQRGQGGQGGQRQMNFDPSQMVTKIYFDDYGKKTVTVTDRGEAGKSRSLVIGEDNYTINDAEKSATKMPSFGGRRGGQGGGGGRGMGMGMGMGMGAQTTPMFDWENLDAKTIKKNKIKELGEEEVAGVMCKKYSVTQNNQGYSTEMTLWIYKNLTMKSETISDWGTMGQTVEKLEETDVDQALFELPKDYKVEEMQMGNFGGGMGGFGGGMGGGDFGGGGFGGGAGGFGGGGMGGFGGGF